jgi:hypothetical protein
VPYVRTVKTKSGAAVQVVYSSRQGRGTSSTSGLAHDEAEALAETPKPTGLRESMRDCETGTQLSVGGRVAQQVRACLTAVVESSRASAKSDCGELSQEVALTREVG